MKNSWRFSAHQESSALKTVRAVFPNEGGQTPLPAQLVSDAVGNARAEQRRLRNGLVLAGFVSCAGDAVGDVLGARAWLYHFRCAPGFCQQGADQPSVWPDEFEIGFARDWARRGEQLLFVCGGCGGAECDSTRRGPRSSSRVYVRLDQSSDRARGGALGFDGVAVCARGDLRCARAYYIDVVINTLVFTGNS